MNQRKTEFRQRGAISKTIQLSALRILFTQTFEHRAEPSQASSLLLSSIPMHRLHPWRGSEHIPTDPTDFQSLSENKIRAFVHSQKKVGQE